MNTETKMSRLLAKTVYVSLVTIFITSSISLTTIVNAQELAPPAGLDDLIVDARIITAARLGELFGTDPIKLLDCDEREWLIRFACAKVIQADREEQERKSGR